MIKGKLYIGNNTDMERLVTLLTKNGYTVRVTETVDLDAFCREYEVIYERREESDEF